MLSLFETILNLSLTGSIVILLIILVRRLLRRIPTKYIYGLWALAAFRLLCPKSPSSVLSLFNYLPKKKISVVSSQGMIEQTSNAAASSAKALEHATSQVTPTVSSPIGSSTKAAGSSLPDLWQILMIVWIIGMGVLAIAILYKSITMYRSLRDTRRIEDNVYSGPSVASPFVLGLLKPRIYMPQGLSDKEYAYLLKHERTHLRRKDIIFKSFFLVSLIVHWFNPLVWIAYWFFESDMEMSCDEEVIKNIGSDLRADYCMSLVSYARKSYAPKYLVTLLGFGKENVKARIKNVMNYKKLSQWLSIICVVVVASIFICGSFSPVKKKDLLAENASESESTKQEETVVTGSETTVAEETTATEEFEFVQVPLDYCDLDEAAESIVEQYSDEPLWGSDEWIELHSNQTIIEYPDVSLPDGALFELDLPRPDSNILFDCEVSKGTIFYSDTLGEFTTTYTVVGETNPSDLVFIVSEELSETELNNYIESLHDFGFTDLTRESYLYIANTPDGCYVIIELYGDTEKYTTIRYCASYTTEDDTMGVG